MGLSGGVDSTVAATLLHKAIGENLTGIFVDNGLLRKNEFENVLKQYEGMGLNVKGVDGTWKQLVDSLNALLINVSEPILEMNQIITAMSMGDMTQTFTKSSNGDISQTTTFYESTN